MSLLLAWSSDVLLCLFDGDLVGREGTAPEPVEVGAERGEPVGVDAIDAAIARRLVNDETGVFEDLQVLRDGGPADREPAGELADRAWPLDQALEDRMPRAISQREPHVMLVSLHSRS